MLIDCPGCANSYHIIRAALGPNGRRVACPRCDTIWFVAANGEIENPETRDLSRISSPIEISADDFFRNAPLQKVASTSLQLANVSPAQVPRANAGRRLQRISKDLLAGATVLALGMALIGFRADVSRLWPQAGSAYAAIGLPINLSGLEVRNLHTITTNDGRETVLGIEGEIVNIRSGETRVPPVHLTIRDAEGRELYGWTATAQRQVLDAGETILFRARLAAPPAGGRQVLATFATETSEAIASR